MNPHGISSMEYLVLVLPSRIKDVRLVLRPLVAYNLVSPWLEFKGVSPQCGIAFLCGQKTRAQSAGGSLY